MEMMNDRREWKKKTSGSWVLLTPLSGIRRVIHTYIILEGVAEVSQIFLRDTHVLPKLVSYEEHRPDGW
jgi:hypothetical protein